jgi:hypothetical protein
VARGRPRLHQGIKSRLARSAPQSLATPLTSKGERRVSRAVSATLPPTTTTTLATDLGYLLCLLGYCQKRTLERGRCMTVEFAACAMAASRPAASGAQPPKSPPDSRRRHRRVRPAHLCQSGVGRRKRRQHRAECRPRAEPPPARSRGWAAGSPSLRLTSSKHLVSLPFAAFPSFTLAPGSYVSAPSLVLLSPMAKKKSKSAAKASAASGGGSTADSTNGATSAPPSSAAPSPAASVSSSPRQSLDVARPSSDDLGPREEAGEAEQLRVLRKSLDKTKAEKERLEAQYKSLVGKVGNMRETLGKKLQEDAVRRRHPSVR